MEQGKIGKNSFLDRNKEAREEVDYKKLYEDALERAKAYHRNELSGTRQEITEYIFPQLAESEDERIRVEIKDFLEWSMERGTMTNAHRKRYGDWITWLEKQKEQPTDAKMELVIKAARRVLNNWIDVTNCPNMPGDFAELEHAIREYDGEEKQKEQNEELVYRLNGLMQKFITESKDEEEQKHRFKCYNLFWDALEDSSFFEQKEQKPVEWSEEERAKMKHEVWMEYKGEHIKALEESENRGYRKGIEDGKILAQSEWSERDKENFNAINNILYKMEYPSLEGLNVDYPHDKVIELRKWFNDLHFEPAEWSELDILTLDSIISIVEDWESKQSEEEKEYYGATQKSDFLKSLPKRFNLPPKQEWSEEDEAHRNFILESLEDQIRFCKKDAEGAHYAKQIRTAQNWLKSLRPQNQGIYQQVVKRLRDMCDRYEYNGIFTDSRARDFLSNVRVKCKDAIECAPILDEFHWKPSEEQMVELKDAVETKGFLSPHLESLYNDLKKL